MIACQLLREKVIWKTKSGKANHCMQIISEEDGYDLILLGIFSAVLEENNRNI